MPAIQSDVFPSFQIREKFAAPIKCRCGQIGSAVWEESDAPVNGALRPVLQEVSSGFYMRLQKKNLSRTEVVCAVCEAVVYGNGAHP
jgi:hypothetical protein